MVISEQGRNPWINNCKTHRPCFLPSSSIPCTSGSFHLQNKHINNDNENIYKVQNPVWQDHSKCMHMHAYTHTRRCLHTHNYTMHDLQTSLKKILHRDTATAMGGENITSLLFWKKKCAEADLQESTEGFHQRRRGWSVHAEQSKAKEANTIKYIPKQKQTNKIQINTDIIFFNAFLWYKTIEDSQLPISRVLQPMFRTSQYPNMKKPNRGCCVFPKS